MEILITAQTTYIMIEYAGQLRRIYTDGRDWPETLERSFIGYSIGKWEDEDGDGRYDTLVVETRGMKGPRTFDASGIPLHKDNDTIVKERIYLDKADPNILHDEITTIDNALTRPWTVTRNYRRERKPIWFEYVCAEGNHHVVVGRENYFVSDDGFALCYDLAAGKKLWQKRLTTTSDKSSSWSSALLSGDRILGNQRLVAREIDFCILERRLISRQLTFELR